MVEVSVIIPSLNEAGTIGVCIEKVKTVFEWYNIDGEIIVADNSDDDTPQIAESLGARVVTPDRRGYGYAYLYGFKHAEGKYVVLGDADNTYDFLEMPRLLEPLMRGEADLVVGSRFKGEIKRGAMPWLHRYVGNPLLTAFLNLFFKAGVSDAHCGFRAIRRDALERLNLRSHGMEFASEMVMEAVLRGLRIREVPVTYHPRRGGRSKLYSFSDGWRHLKFMLFHTPTYLYIFPGTLLAISGLSLIIFSYFRVYIGYTPGLHSMILGSLGLLIGFQLLLFGFCTRIYGININLFHNDRLTELILRYTTLERGAMTGTIIFLGGFIYAVYLVLEWISSGFSILPLKGEDIIAFTLLTLGLQIFFNSFFLSMMISELRKG